MYKYINRCVSYCLKGNIKKCTLNLIALRLIKLIEIGYFISVIYLFVYDKTFTKSINLNTDKYVTVFVCFLAVIIGFVFHFFAMSVDISFKKNIISQFQSCKNNIISMSFLIKLSFLRFIIFVYRFMHTILFLFPSTVFLCIFLKFVQNGVNIHIFVVCVIGSIISFLTGLVTALQLCQQYNLAEYYAIVSYDSNVFECIKHSKYLMDQKCLKYIRLKIRTIPYIIFGLFFPDLYIIAKSREYFFMTDKTIEYARKMHTHKTIVFYFKDVTA